MLRLNVKNVLRRNEIQKSFISVHETDAPIQEQSPFILHWYSYKFDGPCLGYDVGLSWAVNKVEWINGPFCPGKYNDLQMFRRNRRWYLDHGEKVWADRIYSDRKCARKGDELHETQKQTLKIILRLHEVLNSRLKICNILDMAFRYDVAKYRICFYAVANITQLLI